MTENLTPDQKLAIEFEFLCTGDDMAGNCENALFMAYRELEKLGLPFFAEKFRWLSNRVRPDLIPIKTKRKIK